MRMAWKRVKRQEEEKLHGRKISRDNVTLNLSALKTLVIFVDLEGILKIEFGQWMFSVRSVWMWN